MNLSQGPEKIGSLGAIVSAMLRAPCIPVLGALVKAFRLNIKAVTMFHRNHFIGEPAYHLETP